MPADTAKYETRLDSLKLRQSIGYYLAFIALGFGSTALGPTLTDLAAQTSSNLGAFSFVFFAFSFGYLVGSLVSGRLYDRFNGHRIMATVLSLTVIALALVPFTNSLWMVIMILFCSGMFSSTIDVGGNTLIVWVHKDNVDVYMNALHTFFGVGAFLSPIIVAQAIAWTGSIHWAFWSLAVSILPVVFYILSISSPQSPEHGHVAETESNIQGMSSIQNRLVALVAVFFFLYVGAEVSFGGWIATYAKTLGLGNAVTAAYLTSAFWGALTLGRFLSVWLAGYLKPASMLFIDLVGCIVCLCLVLFGSGSPLITWVGTIGTGLFMASIFPATVNLAERRVTITGKVTAWFFVGVSLGGMLLPLFIGQMFESTGPRIAPIVILSAIVMASLVYSIMLRLEKTGSDLQTSTTTE
jgi:FHS family Na+ dependent glucose MFS transporter 1